MGTTSDELLYSGVTRLVGGEELNVAEVEALTSSLSDTNKAMLVRSLLTARNNAGTGYQNVQLGQKTAANSVPVSIASDQSPVDVRVTYATQSATSVIAPGLDMTGRMKTADSVKLIGSQWTYGKLPLTWGEIITGTGSVIEPSAQNSSTYLTLTTGTANNDSVIFQTRRHFRYQVFRTHAISWAFVFGEHQTNVKKMYGQGLNNNGWFIEQSNGTYYFVVRSNVNVTIPNFNETKVARANWNIDKLDGSGPSGLTLDLTKGISWAIEYVWHGTQGIRFGINYFDRLIWCHEIKYTATLSEPFSRNAILPLRAMIQNTGPVSSPGGSMQVGPVSYNVYGGEEEEDGYIFASGNRTTGVSVNSSTTPTYLVAVRPKATVVGANNRSVIVPVSFDILAKDTVYYELVADAIIGTGTWTAPDSRSIAELSTNPGSITNERVISGGYISGGQKGSGTVLSGFAADVFASIDATNNNTPLCFALRVYKTGGNATAYCAVTWKEIY